MDQTDSFGGVARRLGWGRWTWVFGSLALTSLVAAPLAAQPAEPKASTSEATSDAASGAGDGAQAEGSSAEETSGDAAASSTNDEAPPDESAAAEPEETTPEEEELPPLDPNAQEPRPVPETTAPLPRSRLVELGPLVGMAYRPSGADSIQYRPGIAFGGFVRAELTPWLGVRLFYREERLPVDVESGGFDYQGQSAGFEFRQPDLEVLSFGLRVEPTWVVTPRFRLFGALGVSWLRMSAPVPRAEGFVMDGTRAGTEVNLPLGLGASFEILPEWLNASLMATYGLVIDRQGRAYEPLQTIVDGQIFYLAPLPGFQSVVDVLFTLGVIL